MIKYMKNIQTKLLLSAIVFVVAVGFLPNILDFTTKTKPRESISTKQEQQEDLSRKAPDYTKGEVIFDKLKNRVCEELDLCWVAGGYAINGDKILKKEFPTTWGNKTTLIIPRDEWDNLSNQEKRDLGDYLRYRGIDNITAGRVRPAEYSDGSINPNRNVITVDETVWISNN